MKVWETDCIAINFISRNIFKVVFITAINTWLLVAAGHAGAFTICSVPCGVHTEIRNYSYNGYLSDLRVATSQTLPFNLEQFYDALSLTSGSSVPVSLSLTVRRSEEFLGSSTLATGYDYWFSMDLGNLSISGSTLGDNTYGISSYAVSPFKNDLDVGSSTVDELSIFDTDYNATITNSNMELVSREDANIPGTLSIYQDWFRFGLVDNIATGLDESFPEDGSLLETMFDSGNFTLFGNIQVTDDTAMIITPFSDRETFRLNGTIDASLVSFQPTTEQIATVCANLICDDTLSVVPSVPVPGAVWLFASGLLGLAGITRKKKS